MEPECAGVPQIEEKDEALHRKMDKEREQKRNLSRASMTRSYSLSFRTRKLEAESITRNHYALASMAAMKSLMSRVGEDVQ